MNNNYEREFAEVIDVIDHSQIEIVKKIPMKVYNFFFDNMDKEYEVLIDYSSDNWDDNISEDSKAILAIIYRDYIVSPEEKKQLIQEEKEEEAKIEKELREKYNTDDIFKKSSIQPIEEENREEVNSFTNNNINDNTSLKKYNDRIITKIMTWFKNLFSK